MNRPAHAAGGYVFGSSAAEITRLNELAELLQPSTRQVLREAGITDGMTVLDIGCGPGSVAFLKCRAGGPGGVGDRDRPRPGDAGHRAGPRTVQRAARVVHPGRPRPNSASAG